jgi:carbon-monoxide dehydrogenase iron sulfur subunit
MMSVVVFPERCIGCMQCMFECAVAHSQSKNLGAIFEEFLPKPRIHIYPARENYAFPSKCRHCEPAPCIEACPTSAIKREEELVFVDVERCINCGMCAMVCPFGVIRFRVDWKRIEKLPVSYKCDGCRERVKDGKLPACVEVCKVGALRYGDVNELIEEAEKRIASTYSPIFERKEVIPENYKLWLELRR